MFQQYKIIIVILMSVFCKVFISETYTQNQASLIDQIEVSGLDRLSKSEFLKLLPFKKKDIFDENQVSESIPKLFQTGFFKNISVGEKESTTGNKIIVYTVEENVWIKDIDVRANDDIDDKTIKDNISNQDHAFLQANNIASDLKNLYGLYVAKGFVGTDIQITEEKVKKKKNTINLIITVFEGTKLNVRHVKTVGNNLLSETYLISRLQTLKEPYIFGILKYPLIPEMLEYDQKQLVKMALNKGFLDFKVLNVRIIANISYREIISKIKKNLRPFYFSNKEIKKYQDLFIEALNNKDSQKVDIITRKLEKIGYTLIPPKKKSKRMKWKLYIDNLNIQFNSLFNFGKLTSSKLPASTPLDININDKYSGYDVVFYVNEGEQYTFDKVTLLGSKRVNPTFLKKKFLKIDSGDVFNQTQFDLFKNNVAEYYRDKGYFGVTMRDSEVKNPKTLSIEHKILIQEGDKMHIEKMFIKGNKKTKPMVIDRELRIREGSIFNQSQIMLSNRLLERLGYFKKTQIIPSAGSDENLVNLTWNLEEQKTGSLQFGGGYGTETGFSLYGNFKESNLAGLGLTFNAQVQYGEYQKTIQAGISSRYIGYIPIGWNISTGYSWIKEEAAPRYDRNHDGQWDKIIAKDGKYYFVQKDDDDFYDFYDENRTGNFDPKGSSSGDVVSFNPEDEDDLYSDKRYFERQMWFLELGIGYSFADFWSVGISNGFQLSKYDNAHNININNLYEDDYYRLKSDLLSGKFSYSSYLSFSLRFNSSNDSLSPTIGINTFGKADIYGAEGGYDKFIKLQGFFSGFLPLVSLEKQDFYLVWASGINVQSILSLFGQKVQLHYENQLSFDTMTEVRGWADFIYNAELLGLGKITMGTELRMSVPQTNRMLWIVTFFDAGNISLDPGSIPLDFKNYLYSTGVGLRIDIRSFPLRFYLAQRLKWEDGLLRPQGSITFQFAISSQF